MAIANFLEHEYPTPSLLPQDPYLNARVIEFCEIINCIQPMQNVSTLEFLAKDYGIDDNQKAAWLNHWMRPTLEVLNSFVKQYGTPETSIGNSVTLADCFLLPQLFSAKRFGVDFSDLTYLCSVEGALSSKEWVSLAHPQNQPDTPQ